MSQITANLLADAFFARKFIKTMKIKKYDTEVETILRTALSHINDVKNGRIESQNYKSSSKDSLAHLQAYGTAISVVKSLKIFDGEDCIEEYVKSISNELLQALEKKVINPKDMKKTMEYFEQVINFALDEDSRYSAGITYSESYWQPIIKH